MTTTTELLEQIDELADATIGDLPSSTTYTWFPRRTATEVMLHLQVLESQKLSAPDFAARANELMLQMDPTQISVGKPCPFNENFVVFAIFQPRAANEVRVYCVPSKEEKDGKKVSCSRFKLSKLAPIFGLEYYLKVDTFAAEIAEEWDRLDEKTAEVSEDDDGVRGDGEDPADPDPNDVPGAPEAGVQVENGAVPS